MVIKEVATNVLRCIGLDNPGSADAFAWFS
jgi:hypothetical protein